MVDIKNISYRLYGITDQHYLNGDTLYNQVHQALQGGLSILQLREKELDEESFVKEATEIRELCHQYDVPLIINDNLNVAIRSNADGIHIGQDDIDIEIVKERFPNKIIGVTAHNLEEALKAYQQGASYLGCGAIFPSSTKDNTIALSIEELKKICLNIDIPVVAIGGITLDNMTVLKDTGISGVALVSAIFNSSNITESCKKINEELRCLL